MVPGFPPGFTPNGFNPFQNFGNHQVQAPPTGWPMQASSGGDDLNHQGGPMRRGGGRFNNMRTGPYDRRGGPRFGANGRLTPPRNGMRGGMGLTNGAGKWGDGAGAQAMGPREAVQGRSLKSYEDLDDVGGGGAGELNY